MNVMLIKLDIIVITEYRIVNKTFIGKVSEIHRIKVKNIWFYKHNQKTILGSLTVQNYCQKFN